MPNFDAILATKSGTNTLKPLLALNPKPNAKLSNSLDCGNKLGMFSEMTFVILGNSIFFVLLIKY